MAPEAGVIGEQAVEGPGGNAAHVGVIALVQEAADVTIHVVRGRGADVGIVVCGAARSAVAGVVAPEANLVARGHRNADGGKAGGSGRCHGDIFAPGDGKALRVSDGEGAVLDGLHGEGHRIVIGPAGGDAAFADGPGSVGVFDEDTGGGNAANPIAGCAGNPQIALGIAGDLFEIGAPLEHTPVGIIARILRRKNRGSFQ